jgi:hypothetical protein
MIKNNQLLRIIRFIDYVYLSSYVVNSLKTNNYNEQKNMSEWKIFSTQSKKDVENKNIMYLIKLISSQKEFNYDVLLISIHIYIKICNKYAHLIDNYTYLFGSVYISINKDICYEFLTDYFLSCVLNINLKTSNYMVKCVNKFIVSNDIFFGIEEKIKIINCIYNS